MFIFRECGGDGHEKISQKRQRDSDRADHDVLPCGLKGSAVPVEIDQGRGGQSCGLDSNPDKSEVLTHGDQRHHCQKKQQTADKSGFPGIGEQKTFFKILVLFIALSLQIPQGIQGNHGKECAGNAQKEQPQVIQKQPVIQNRGRGVDPRQRRQHGMTCGGCH